MRLAVLLTFVATAAVSPACNKDKGTEPPSGMPGAPANLPPADPTAPSPSAQNVHPSEGTPPSPAAPPTPITGRIAEKIDAPSYTYLRITTRDGDLWAAVPTAKVAVGETVTVSGQMVMSNFQSKALNRTFDKLVFGTLDAVPPGSAAAVPPGANPHAGVPGAPALGQPAAPPPPEIGDLKVPRAEGAGAHTIAEVFGKRDALKDKPVAVRGKVVKYTSGVMGKSWAHLRDATGTDAKQDNDLTVVTQDEAKVGDVVTARGVVHLDRDFGAGYRYAVIVEDAKLGK